MAVKKTTDIVPTMLRIRETLRRQLQAKSKQNNRSLNAEMAGRLEISLVRDDREARDTWIVDILTSNQESSELFRSIVLEIQRDPKWADTQKDTDDLIKRIEFEIRSAAKYVQFQEKHGNDLR